MREELLAIIEKNSRIDLKELAVILGVEEIDVVNELAALEAEGIICGYHTLINWEKTDIEKVSALIEVRVTPQRGQGFDSIAERIYKYPEVRSVYLMSGAYDLMVILEGKTLREVIALTISHSAPFHHFQTQSMPVRVLLMTSTVVLQIPCHWTRIHLPTPF